MFLYLTTSFGIGLQYVAVEDKPERVSQHVFHIREVHLY